MSSTPVLLDPASDAASIVTAPPASNPVPVVAVSETAPVTDKFNRIFRPGFHRTNPDGTPFRNRKGGFMPKGGKKPKTEIAVQIVPQPETAAKPQTVPESTGPVKPEPQQPEIAPLPAPKPTGPAWSDAERAAAATVTPSPASPGAQSEPEQFDASDDAAEVIALAVFFIVGIVFGAPEEATPVDAEQKKLVRITAALIRSTGWKGTQWWAAGLSWAAYFLRFVRKPKAAAQVQAWVNDINGKVAAARPVEPAAQPKTVPEPPSAGAARPASDFPGFVERSAS